MPDLSNKVIITAALTGAVTPKSSNPNIPITPEEIADDAYACWQAGAAVVHLHMRDENAMGTMDVARFKKTVELIQKRCDVVINLTTSGDHRATDDERMAHIIELKPEIASFDSGSFNWMPAGVFMNSPQFLEKLARVMLENEVKPEIEVFDAGMIHIAEYYMAKGLIKRPPHFQLCLGVLGGARATVDSLVYLRNLLPADATWSAFGIGKDHLPILYTTIAMGGHIRVGLEDNIYYAKGRLTSNVELVERAVRLVKEANKEVATPDEARRILNLKGAK
ncbi:3-keto-5-aminohexanoate cleavage protein [Moorella sulfitireducens]|uniref:3-keto-5-aminohexanoate cleavage protein n=1 Tax=Neomoorella sulfitireducens TaxID=2972948 RepID=UPI0021ABF703|nr:3-keto-5-aminohexanoate cleavage protein [Moorella sulfitireducens]